jgi:hypothetical protein
MRAGICDRLLGAPGQIRTLRVSVTTSVIGHRITDRDVELARYFDGVYPRRATGKTRPRGGTRRW